MTLCIAASCLERRKPRIVIGADNRIETYMAGADIQSKLYWFGDGQDNVGVLVAGNLSEAIQLGDTYRRYFQQRDEMQKDSPSTIPPNLVELFKAPLIQHKYKLAEEYTGKVFGLTYKAFLQAVAAKQIPTKSAEDAFNTISKIRLGCCLLLFFFYEGDSYIFKVEEDGSVERCEHFATIGAGAGIADGVLYYRAHAYDRCSLSKTIYHVYEAMKLGSIAPGVSRESLNVAVLYPPGEKAKVNKGVAIRLVNDVGYEILEQEFEKKGPRHFDRATKLDEDCFEAIGQY